MSSRRTEGRETWARLREWDRDQSAAERLSAHILRVEGFRSIDPSHPLGGPDGLKDIICLHDKLKWIGAAFFPRGQKKIAEIIKKFNHDLKGVKANDVNGIVFVTNQELRLGERDSFKKSAGKIEVELYHLERIASILDSPQCYGIRLEFLDIEMKKEEQLAFIATRDAKIERLQDNLERIILYLQNSDILKNLTQEQIKQSIPLSDIREFKDILDSIVGYDPFTLYSSSISASSFGRPSGHIRDLYVPLNDLKDFEQILNRIVGYKSPFSDITTTSNYMFNANRTIQDLQVPLNEIKEYEETLDRIIQKLQKKKMLE